MSKRLKSSLRKALQPVKPAPPEEGKRVRQKELPPPVNIEELPATEDNKDPTAERRGKEYVELEVSSSKGKKYKVVVPASYAKHIPKKWEWTAERYRVAQMIADGIPISQIAEDPSISISGRITIYGWLEHPEFREHVDGLTLESGFASKRERIAGLNRLTQKLFNKVVNELDATKLNEKSIGAVLSTILSGMKQLAQEKEEFIEASKVEQQTTLNGTLGVAHLNVTEVLNSKTDEERKALEKEFDAVADEIIRSLTGEKD